MKNVIYSVFVIFLSFIFISCSGEDSNPINSNEYSDWEGQVGKYNTTYFDSVLFTSTRNLGTNYSPSIYIMHKDGSGIRALTNRHYAFAATYSPRRLKVLFVADTSSASFGRALFSMDVDGTNQKTISQSGEDVWAVACSPDGLKIAYIILESGKGKIRVINTEENSVQDVTDLYGSFNFSTISWSKDSEKIVFDGLFNDRIGIANADGSGYEELFSSSSGCYQPRCSPDGKFVAYSSFSIIDGEYFSNIFLYNFSDKTSKVITRIKGFCNNPCWTEESNTVMFSSRGIGNSPSYLYEVDINTEEVVQITNGSGSDWNPNFW